jgi:hypothetical protein
MCLLPLAVLGWTGAAAAKTQSDKPACTPAAVTTVDGLAGDAAEIVAFDLSGSTHSAAVREAYKQLGANVMTRARDERAVFAILTFTSSSSSAKLAYAGSFKPSTGDEVFDLGQKNRVTCEAGVVIDRLFAPARGVARTTGSDPAGATAAAVSLAGPFLKGKRPVTVTVATDGWIAPAVSGPNKSLFDLRAAIARGASPNRIIAAHREQLLVTNASGVNLVFRGLDQGANAGLGNTVRANRLTTFYSTLCQRLGARSCDAAAHF